MTTLHREGNRAKWVGVRPAHDGSQVVDYVTGSTAGVIAVLRTVTAGKTFMLTHYDLSLQSANAAGSMTLFVTDASDVLQYNISKIRAIANTVNNKEGNFWPPIEIPAGYKVKTQMGAGSTGDGTTAGWEE